jgi:hypothetical protein
MDSDLPIAPWQVAPVTPLARITAGALVAVVVDSLFLWRTVSHVLFSAAALMVVLIVALRLLRGLALAPIAAAAILATTLALAAIGLASFGAHPPHAKAALVVAAAISVLGFVAACGAQLEQAGAHRRANRDRRGILARNA